MTQYTDTLANMQEYKANGFTEAQAAILAKTLENTIKNAATSTELSFVKTEKKIKDVKEENKEIKSVLGEIGKTLARLELNMSELKNEMSMMKNNFKFYAFAIVISILFFDKAYPSILSYILNFTSK